MLISCLFTFISGVSERELQDKDTRDFIYDFIDRHGGIEAALEEVENRNRTPAPAPPPRQSSIARPPPPSKVCTLYRVSHMDMVVFKVKMNTIFIFCENCKIGLTMCQK